jgi:exopolyphosphatase/pppGpp-phosphohydrolase
MKHSDIEGTRRVIEALKVERLKELADAQRRNDEEAILRARSALSACKQILDQLIILERDAT